MVLPVAESGYEREVADLEDAAAHAGHYRVQPPDHANGFRAVTCDRRFSQI
jgi:hypothetical protein